VAIGQAVARPEQAVAQRGVLVLAAVNAAALELGHEVLDHVLERPRADGVGEVEAVDVGLVHPGLHLIGDLARIADEHRPAPAYGRPRGDVAQRPGIALWVGAEEHGRGGLDRVLVAAGQRGVEVVAGEVQAGPAREQDERRLVGAVGAQIVVLGPRAARGLVDDDRRHRVDAAVVALAPRGLELLADPGDERRDDLDRRAAREDRLRVAPGEAPAA